MPGMSPVIWGSEKNQKRFAGQVEEWKSGVHQWSSGVRKNNGKKMLFLSEKHGIRNVSLIVRCFFSGALRSDEFD